MRLFIAIELGDTTLVRAHALLAELKRRASSRHAKITWVATDRMHLTVRFIGEVNETSATRIQDALAPALSIAPFTFTCEGLVAMPAARRPRVLACGIGEGRERVLAVEEAVSTRLLEVGVPREARPYSPHVTLARVRDAAGVRVAQLFEGLEHVSLGATSVGTIRLVHSRLSPKGPTYTVLMTTVLAA